VEASGSAAVDLYWLPLGAGGHFVRLNGRVYEWIASHLARRPSRDLYHSALQVEVPEGRFVIEQAPAGPDGSASSATRSGCGAAAISPTWPRLWTARAA
jgi:hypothetical protein